MVIKGLFFFFFFFITYHSSLNFRHLSLITHHLKYPNFLYLTRLAHIFSFSSLSFLYFLWELYLSTMSSNFVSLPASHSFYFIFQPSKYAAANRNSIHTYLWYTTKSKKQKQKQKSSLKNKNLLRSLQKSSQKFSVRTSFGLDPKQDWVLAQ